MRLLGATSTHEGNVREANQDRVFFRGPVAALADGMGGHQGGERAAQLAIDEFKHAGGHLSETGLVDVVLQANRQVHDHAAHNGLPGMGTTVVAMTLHDDNTITVANVGDSRAYWLRGDYMGQVTEDHSFVEDLVRQGRLTPEEAEHHPQRNILTRAVGIGAEVEVDRFPIPEPEVGDRFLLCSDGLFNELSEAEILEILLDSGGPTETAAALIEATLRTPCRDNVTVAVVDLVEDDDPRLAAQEAEEEASQVDNPPMPQVSKSTLHRPGSADGAADDGADQSASDAAASSPGVAGDSPAGLATATLLREGADDAAVDPEAFRDTAELDVVEDDEPGRVGLGSDFDDRFNEAAAGGPPESVQPRSKAVLRVGAGALVVALAIGGFFGARAIARSGGVHVAADESGQLMILEGRRGGFLLFEPSVVGTTDVMLSDLTEAQQARLAQDFDTSEAAQAYLDDTLTVAPPEAEDDPAAGASASSSSQETDEPSTDQAETTQLTDSTLPD
jgi:protein phosphatase